MTEQEQIAQLEALSKDIQTHLDQLDMLFERMKQIRAIPIVKDANAPFNPHNYPVPVPYVPPTPTVFEGTVVPRAGYNVNVRAAPSIVSAVIGVLKVSEVAETVGSAFDEDGSSFLWHTLKQGGYVRADVVTLYAQSQ